MSDQGVYWDAMKFFQFISEGAKICKNIVTIQLVPGLLQVCAAKLLFEGHELLNAFQGMGLNSRSLQYAKKKICERRDITPFSPDFQIGDAADPSCIGVGASNFLSDKRGTTGSLCFESVTNFFTLRLAATSATIPPDSSRN